MAGLITGSARLVTGAQARWLGCGPQPIQRIYFANHASHVDILLIFSALPLPLRMRTRPVAGSDYWEKGKIRRYLVHNILNAVLVDRTRVTRTRNPLEPMLTALDDGDSLIIFPEGTRNTTEHTLLPFKSGLYHLASRRPGIDIVPVWMDNLGRVLPKGEIVPVPLLCSVNFGEPMRLLEGESRADFLARAHAALLHLAETAGPK